MKWLAIVVVVTLTPGITLAAITTPHRWVDEFRKGSKDDAKDKATKPTDQSSDAQARKKAEPAEELSEDQRRKLNQMRRGLRNGYKPKPIGTQPKVDYRQSPLIPSYQTPSRRPYETHYRIRALRRR